MKTDGVKISINTVFEKRLYTIKSKSELVTKLKEQNQEIDLSNFYNIFYIDEEKLRQQIEYFLQLKPQVSLEEVVQKFPVKKGVAELISYLSLAKKGSKI